MTRGRALNLTAALSVVALADLALYRLAGPFLPARPGPGVARVLTNAGLFVLHLGGVLGWLVAAATMVMLFRRGELFPRSMRLTLGTVTIFFLVLAGASVVQLGIADRLVVHLKTSHAFLAWLVVISVWRTEAPLRARLGVTLFALPAVVQAAALFGDRLGWGRGLPEDLQRAGELTALAAAALAPLLLTSWPLRPSVRVAGVVAGIAAAVVVAGGLLSSFELVEAIALYCFRLELSPLSSAGAIGHAGLLVAACWGLVTAVIWCFGGAGPERLVGWGVVLLAAAGPQPLVPAHVLFAVCGLLSLAVGLSRRHPAPVA